ncbi:hypothetical protein CHLRE_03g200350v5 [Chlamydomonas reinhardtii]|uniref:Methyltransferase type 11 domain-containing protein n=1 Tax=Chlamydomonas reinhardtii TaxID=3055 RepID=A0A2K3DZF8_CHLRE|nr:uncharacterized protein CHLRE_03g200350v5 [Chlamydomonas reinhardtii]XP_042926583.1 uncharacterized protein CHLRE_03g200350v5 [Chlamydomonas reinhardtii]PNW85911.1 hypothetical protein CHLRE_03g200350v5 [Chlamydomonas reinhardtii]PNW85912.1 hypothetical protein CHLRE_03g200350v5 [Chlamydomonas reinhardtii]
MQSTLPSCSSRNVFGAKRQARAGRVVVRAETAARDKPAWTGDSVLSRVVNWAIDTPALYGAMKVLAKNAMKNSAESRGVKWDAHVKEMEKLKELEAIKSELEDPGLQPYPDYYLKPFHAYETGNLEWLAAWEVQPATYAMGIRTFKDHPDWSAEKCFVEMRSRQTDTIKSYHAQHGLPLPRRIVDMGCSTGISTTWFAQQFPDTDGPIVGLDLSPYMLAVAEWERRRQQQQQAANQPRSAPIKYVHGLAEKSPFGAASQDMVVFNFVIHECPQHAIDSFVSEGLRIIKPNGVLCFIDNNPKSKTIQNLPAPIFTLMKSTEPWSDEYYSYDLEAAMRAAGFREVVTVETDHRHRCVMGIRP